MQKFHWWPSLGTRRRKWIMLKLVKVEHDSDIDWLDWSSSGSCIFVSFCGDERRVSVIHFGLRAGWSGVQVPTRAGNFTVQHRIQTGSGAHPATYPMGTRGRKWKVYSYSSGQGIPWLHGTPKVNYHVHRSPHHSVPCLTLQCSSNLHILFL